MDKSTYVLVASGNQRSNATSVSSHTGSSVPSSMILVPRASYAATVTKRTLPNQLSTVTGVVPSFTLKQGQSGSSEIRLIVANPKDSRQPAPRTVRACVSSGSFSSGLKMQVTSGSGAVTVAKTLHSTVSNNSSIANTLMTQRSPLPLLTPMHTKNTGNTSGIINGAMWNALSVVDTNNGKSAGEPVSSAAELMIQIRPEQFKQLTSQSSVNNAVQQTSGSSSTVQSRFSYNSQHSRVSTSHQPIQPKIAPTVQMIALPTGSSIVINRSKTPAPIQPNLNSRTSLSVSVSTSSASYQRRILPAVPQMRHNVSPSASSCVGLGGLMQPVQTAVTPHCSQVARGVVHQTTGAMGQTFTYVSQPSYTFVQTQSGLSFSHPHKTAVCREVEDHMESTRFAGNWLHQTQCFGTDTLAAASRPKKPCNCTKSQCLKLYCECFAGGEFCSDCNCTNCFNNLAHEDDRTRAVKACLDRNPHAFHPKIGKGGSLRQHCKGCNCKRSGCLKNYCECYEAKIPCSNLCRCIGCKNFEDSPDRQTLLHLADAAEVRVQQQAAAETKLSNHVGKPPVRLAPPPAGVERPAYMFINLDVIEAICTCLVAEAERGERDFRSEIIEERELINEFSRSLRQVIDSASRTRALTPFDD